MLYKALPKHQLLHAGIIYITHSSRFRYHCDLCGKGFHNPAGLQGHKVSTHNMVEERVACPVCGKQYTQSSNMRAHMISVHRVKPGDLKGKVPWQ